MKKLIAIFLILAVSNAKGADSSEYPSIGHLHSKSNGAGIGLKYDCTKTGEILNCLFTQVFLRQKTSKEDAASEIQQSKQEFSALSAAEIKEVARKVCGKKADTAILDSIRRHIATGKKELAENNLADDMDYLKLIAVMEERVDSCGDDKRVAELMLEEGNISKETETRTCKISLNQYEKQFGFNPDTRQWIVNEGPSGNCGLVVIGIWEQEKGWLWNYTERRTITNRAGMVASIDCQDSENLNVRWTWKPMEKGVSFECSRYVFSAY